MKYVGMDKIKDPFILELQEVFGVTGFTFKKDDELYIVGHPTQKKTETKKQYKERWRRWEWIENTELKKQKLNSEKELKMRR